MRSNQTDSYSPIPSSKQLSCTAVVTALLLILIVYGETLGYKFDYDDYHQVRPHSLAEIFNSFTGNWDALGIERPFYRPITLTYYAVRFFFIGYNPFFHHLLSLVFFSIISLQIYQLLYIHTQNSRFSYLAMVMWICHPYLAHSAVVWATNQMHLLSLMVLLAAWKSMIRSYSGPPLRLAYIYGWQLLAFLIKEDGIMIPVVLFPIWLFDNYGESAFPRPHIKSWLIWLGVPFMTSLLFIFRRYFLGNVGGYNQFALGRIPDTLVKILTLSQASKHYTLYHFWITRSAQFFTLAVLVIGLTAIFFQYKKSMFPFTRLLVAGLSILIGFNMLTVFSTKIYQWHMQSLGHVLLLSTCTWAIIRLLIFYSINRKLRLTGLGVIGFGILSLLLTTRILASTFAPFTYQTIQHDLKVLQWKLDLSQRHIDYLLQKSQDPRFHQFED